MSERPGQSDPFNLSRFVTAQEHSIDGALSELRRGRKQGHWMWFIFPQIYGLGSSPTAELYAIKDMAEAGAYLKHPILGPRLLNCCRALLSVQGRAASEIMGYPDDLKLRSSMTLFLLVPDAPPEFKQVLDKYYAGKPDPRTLELLESAR